MENSKKLIDKIKEQQVKPVPRWRFLFKDGMTWGLFIFAVIFGSLAFSVILFAIQQMDFNIISHMSHSWFELLLGLLPFFWIISMVILLIIAIVSIKNSKKGYKFSISKVLGFCAALSILVGILFFISGGGRWLENAFSINVSLYESVQEKKTKLWSMPEEGYLSGTVMVFYGDSLQLKDFNEKTWTIILTNADIVPAVRFNIGEKIKLMGKMISDNRFYGEKVRPWGNMGRYE
jgi:hypothetical protein